MNALDSLDISGLDAQERLLAVLIRTVLAYMAPAEARRRLAEILGPRGDAGDAPRLDGDRLAALIVEAAATVGVALAAEAPLPDPAGEPLKAFLADFLRTLDAAAFVRQPRPAFAAFLLACAAALEADED